MRSSLVYPLFHWLKLKLPRIVQFNGIFENVFSHLKPLLTFEYWQRLSHILLYDKTIIVIICNDKTKQQQQQKINKSSQMCILEELLSMCHCINREKVVCISTFRFMPMWSTWHVVTLSWAEIEVNEEIVSMKCVWFS